MSWQHIQMTCEWQQINHACNCKTCQPQNICVSFVKDPSTDSSRHMDVSRHAPNYQTRKSINVWEVGGGQTSLSRTCECEQLGEYRKNRLINLPVKKKDGWESQIQSLAKARHVRSWKEWEQTSKWRWRIWGRTESKKFILPLQTPNSKGGSPFNNSADIIHP